MGASQMMLTMAAAFLLSITILTVNRELCNTNTVMSSSRYNIMAVSLGTSIMEDATSMAFDEKTVTAALTDSTQLTAPSSLGIESGEAGSLPSGFDDFDDYNIYNNSDINHPPKQDTLIVDATTNKKVIFKTICKVDYVSTANPATSSSIRTWSKRLKLSIYSSDLADPATLKTDTIKLATVYSYWYFK
jgi:hypothetical protein